LGGLTTLSARWTCSLPLRWRLRRPHHFAGNLAAAASDHSAVGHARLDIQAAIEGRGVAGPNIAARHVGRCLGPHRGLSIYVPPFRDPVFSRELDVARVTRWAELL